MRGRCRARPRCRVAISSTSLGWSGRSRRRPTSVNVGRRRTPSAATAIADTPDGCSGAGDEQRRQRDALDRAAEQVLGHRPHRRQRERRRSRRPVAAVPAAANQSDGRKSLTSRPGRCPHSADASSSAPRNRNPAAPNDGRRLDDRRVPAVRATRRQPGGRPRVAAQRRQRVAGDQPRVGAHPLRGQLADERRLPARFPVAPGEHREARSRARARRAR